MRKIEKLMVLAIRGGWSLRARNTKVVFDNHHGGFSVYLYGSLIARGHRFNDNGFVIDCATFAGYKTRTTTSRLRALGVDVKKMVTNNGWTHLCSTAT